MTQNTTCSGSYPYKCQCLPSQYFNIVNQNCEDKILTNATCNQINACETGFCFGPTFTCQCLTTQFFNTSSNRCETIVISKTTSSSTTTSTETTGDPKAACLRMNSDSIERYWNGFSCVNALGYGKNCSYLNECQYLTQNTTCGIIVPFKCQCSSKQYFNFLNSKCENLLSINETCTQIDACHAGFCFGNPLMCRCLSNEYFDTVNSSCIKILTESDCQRISSANVEMYWNGTQCIDALAYNQSCTNSSSNYMCRIQTESTICDGWPSRCICDKSKYFNYLNIKCENISSINGTCSQNDACNTTLGLSCITELCQCDIKIQFWNTITKSCVNYLSYNDGTCTADDQCLVNLNCISNRTTCNCPTNVTFGKCDCPSRFNGSEYYWDGFNCTLALSYGQACSNESTRYMCQTFTQGTVCSGPPFKCKCPTTQYFKNVANKCENFLSINETCQQLDACNHYLGLNCNSGDICQCNSTQFWDTLTNNCRNHFSYNQGTCTADDQCIGGNLICLKNGSSCNCPASVDVGKCDCPPRINGSEYYWNGFNCSPSLALNERCSNSSASYMCQTITQGTICSGLNDTCQCNITQYFNSTAEKCENLSTLNDICSASINLCNSNIGLSCQSGYCKCNSTQFWSNYTNSCKNPFGYNDGLCATNNQCSQQLFCRLNRESCNCPTNVTFGKCDCPSRFNGSEYYWDGFNCTLALSYGQACSNESTRYMCQTFTQGTVCSGPPFKCKCPTTQYFKNVANKCENFLSINETCQQLDACNHYLGLNCNSGDICQCNSTQFWDTLTNNCRNHFSYNQGTCTADDQCIGGNLICLKNGSSCNCPASVDVGKCDCPPRINGSEYYWNGFNCTHALDFNQTCVNTTSSNYMCQTITEGTACVESYTGGPFKCFCNSTQYYNITTKRCENILTHNDTCIQMDACDSRSLLSCRKGICECNTLIQFWSTSIKNCTDRKGYSRGICLVNSDCTGNLICQNLTSCSCPTLISRGHCDCPTRTFGSETYYNGFLCTDAASYGQACPGGQDYECKVLAQNLRCNTVTYKCDCIIGKTWNATQNDCL